MQMIKNCKNGQSIAEDLLAKLYALTDMKFLWKGKLKFPGVRNLYEGGIFEL